MEEENTSLKLLLDQCYDFVNEKILLQDMVEKMLQGWSNHQSIIVSLLVKELNIPGVTIICYTKECHIE